MEDYGIFEGLFSEITTSLIKDELNKIKEEARIVWEKFEDNRAAKAYRAKLEKRYGTIQILGQPEPQALGEVYTDVYLHDRPTNSYAMGINQLIEEFQIKGRFGRDERISGLEFAKKQERLFILGKPGSGKTTFLKHLTIQATRGKNSKIPIFISLNDLAKKKPSLLNNKKVPVILNRIKEYAEQKNLIDIDESILEYITAQFEICNFPDTELFVRHLLKKGIGLILFDGIDEVKKKFEGRDFLTQALNDFINKFDKNQFVVTCRIAASDYNFVGFKYVEMADFTDEQVRRFIRSWFAKDKLKLDGFLQEIENKQNNGMKEMTTSPLLLTLLCIQYDGSMAFPPFQSEIYEKALTVLLETWDTHRSISRDDLVIENENNYRALTTKRKMQLMSRLAYYSFVKGDLFIKQRWLELKVANYLGKMPNLPDKDLIDGKIILKGMESQHGLLVERATRIYSFSHLTLQEYFTAKYIAEHSSVEALSVLVSEDKLTDYRWREVFLFVAELLPEGDEFVTWMAETLQAMSHKRELSSLVEWATRRTNEKSFTERHVHSRLSYLHRYLTRALSHDHSLPVDNSLALNLNRVLDIVNMRSQGVIFDLAFNRALGRDRTGARAAARESTQALGLSFDLANDHFDAMSISIQESQRLNWTELTIALENVPYPDNEDQNDKWRLVWQELNNIEKEFILDNFKWKLIDVTSIYQLINWLNGHELLFECLDRTILEDVDRETFEDEMLYCLPKSDPI